VSHRSDDPKVHDEADDRSRDDTVPTTAPTAPSTTFTGVTTVTTVDDRGHRRSFHPRGG